MLQTHSTLSWLTLITMALSAGACAQDIRPTSGGSPADGNGSAEDPIEQVDHGDGTYTTTVSADVAVDEACLEACLDEGGEEEACDAKCELWIFFDLETAQQVNPLTPEDSDEWDVAFQRFKVKTNGGISGSGGVEGARLAGVDFSTLDQAPPGGYVVDAEDSGDEDVDPDYVFLGPAPWYDYDGTGHTLSPADAVYVLRSVEGNYFKVQMLDYYDDAGTSGFPKLRWGPIQAPDPDEPVPEGLAVDVSDTDTWAYVVLATGTLVSVDDPDTSTDWDVAFSATVMKTNGGASGPGLGGAREADSSDWDAISTAPTVGFELDTAEGARSA